MAGEKLGFLCLSFPVCCFLFADCYLEQAKPWQTKGGKVALLLPEIFTFPGLFASVGWVAKIQSECFNSPALEWGIPSSPGGISLHNFESAGAGRQRLWDRLCCAEALLHFH